MTTPHDTTQGEFDEIEDLTMFADESFDTDEVDLFEFTGEDDAPLTRLKSIILSLDWEINNDILEELAEELENLRQMWQDDKVAQVYLQGLGKIGNYLKTEGAYAHPNAIKLLLTFFYDFEKIISSEKITGDTITALLKADVRKFKILQYQINQLKGAPSEDMPEDGIAPPPSVEEVEEAPAPETAAGETGAVAVACGPLTELKATILGLEWEVTSNGLEQFNNQIVNVREHFQDNKAARILIQGLQALGAYITEERANAHPEAFSLLHSFYQGLELLLENEKLSDEERQDLLVERVNSLNHLKVLIAENSQVPEPHVADQIIDEVMSEEEEAAKEEQEERRLDEEGENEEFSLDLPEDVTDETAAVTDIPATISPAMETADQAYPEDILDADAIKPVADEVSDEFIEEELSIGTDITPALAGSEEITDERAVRDEELEEELDLFFSAGDEENEEEDLRMEPEASDWEEPEELVLSFDQEEDEISEEANALIAALEESEGPKEEEEVGILIDEDAEEELSFAPALGDAEEEGGFDEGTESAGLAEEPSEELEGKLDAFFGSDEEAEPEEKPETDVSEEEDLFIVPALDDAEEESGFSEELVSADLNDEETTMDLDDKLDSFFGIEEEEKEPEEFELTAALSDAEEEGGFDENETIAALADEEETNDLDDKLDSFFGEEEVAVEPVESEEEREVAPALSEVGEEGGFDDTETVAALADEEATTDLDDKLDSFFGEEEETGVSEEAAEPVEEETQTGIVEEEENFFISEEEESGTRKGSLFSDLGTGLAALAAGGGIMKGLAKSRQLIGELKDEEAQSTEQKVLLELLHSVLTIIPDKETDELPEGTSELVNYLYQQIETAEPAGDVLIEAVNRFTGWQQSLVSNILKALPKPRIDDEDTETTVVASEVRAGFDILRSTLKEEFNALREELKKNP